MIYAEIACKCGKVIEGTFSDKKAAEFAADRHESVEGFKRQYKHDTTVVNVRETK